MSSLPSSVSSRPVRDKRRQEERKKVKDIKVRILGFIINKFCRYGCGKVIHGGISVSSRSNLQGNHMALNIPIWTKFGSEAYI